MSGGLDAAADVVSGGVVARAVSGHAPEPHGGEVVHGACRNCDAPLMGAYCFRCGQSSHLHRTLGAIGHEIAHGVFHFEGRIWHTLPLLAWKPGALTRRYVHGQRARFVSPLALFLFCVFLMFATFHLVGGPFGGGDTHALKAKQASQAPLTDQDRRKDEAALAKLENQRDALLATNPRTAAVLNTAIEQARARLGAGDPQVHFRPPVGADENLDIHLGWSWLDAIAHKATENPDLLIYKVEVDGYKYSWLLIPFSLPFIWVAFAFRRDVTLYDHAIFAIHSLSFMMILTIVLSLLVAAGVGDSWTGLLMLVVPPVHIYRHLKGAYLLTRLGAVWRTGWLLVSATVALTAFAIVLVSMGLSD